MWELINHSPFEAAGCFLRDHRGIENWVVAVRGRFDAEPDGFVSISERQENARLQPEYRDFGSAEMIAEADFAPFRRSTDVLIAGRATARGGMPVRACRVRFRVGLVEKAAIVIGERRLKSRKRGAVVDGPDDFLSVPLTWRASLGGKDPVPGGDEDYHPGNPLGRGWTRAWCELPETVDLDLPLIENEADRVTPGKPLPEPHGFGPIQPGWLPRRRYAGTFDEKWRRECAPLFPGDFHAAFYQAAPPDQVYDGVLRGGEPAEIEGLHEMGSYRFQLPTVLLDATTKLGRDRIGTRLHIVSLTIDGSAKKIDLTWNAAVPCHRRDHELEWCIVSMRQMSGVAP